MDQFQSISPYGEKHHWDQALFPELISIHLPLRGETIYFRHNYFLHYFNPSPLTGRNNSRRKKTEFNHFNPSPLTGRNQYNVRICDIYKFQSISPYGEKLYEWTFPVKLWISIHLPLRGETSSRWRTSRSRKFQSISPYGEKHALKI